MHTLGKHCTPIYPRQDTTLYLFSGGLDNCTVNPLPNFLPIHYINSQISSQLPWIPYKSLGFFSQVVFFFFTCKGPMSNLTKYYSISALNHSGDCSDLFMV